MILVDTGPLVALFDPADAWHQRCVELLRKLDEPACTTVAVLTEALHMLSPDSLGAERLIDFIDEGGLALWHLDDDSLSRAFELMLRYRNIPMDLADASLVVAAEKLKTRRVFTIDRKDFSVYRVQRGHRHMAFEMLR